MARIVIGSAASALAIAAGLWLGEQLRDPYSDLRLWLAGIVDNVKGEA